MIENILSKKYILASGSPRRIKLLKQIGLNFIVAKSNFHEKVPRVVSPVNYVRHNAENKCRMVAGKFKNGIIIAADTIVVLNREVLNKPRNNNEAVKFLKKLSGKTHNVFTGIYVLDIDGNKSLFGYEKTSVKFRKLSLNEISYYVKNHKPLDKAGSYGIQDDFGCLFVSKITGDYYNVVGLPLVKLYELLNRLIG